MGDLSDIFRGKRLRSLDEFEPRRTWHGHDSEQAQRRNHSHRVAGTVPLVVLLGVALGLAATYVDLPFPAGSNAQAATASLTSQRFSLCHTGGGTNCVVDGDTIWLNGEKIRIADIDTPETHPPRCEREANLGARATNRLHALLNAAPFEVEAAGLRDEDKYGRKLRIIVRDGQSLGDTLVAEGLARPYGNGRRSWCA